VGQIVPPSRSPGPTRYFSKRRLEAFSDGVFAIVITLLVLEIKIPPDLNQADFTHQLVELGPRLLAYLLSFLMVGIYWVMHNGLFHTFVAQVDRNLLWLNNLVLLGAGFLPFTADLLGNYGAYIDASAIYGANLVFASLAVLALFTYVTRNADLQPAGIDPHAAALARRRLIASVLVYTLAIGVSFLSPAVSILIYFIVPVIYVLLGRFDSI